MIDALPEDGELGSGWERVSAPRAGDDAEPSSLCDTALSAEAVESAKIDLARDEDFASTFYRRYEDEDGAVAAFATAADRIARCESAEEFAVLEVGAPSAGDATFSAVFAAPGGDPALAGDFGWTLVRTGAVIRSLQLIPAASGDLETELRLLAEALARTG